MADQPHTPWLASLLRAAASVEGGVDALRYGLRGRLGGERTPRIAAYRTYGTVDRLHVIGRVLRDAPLPPASADASAWRNMVDTYRRFETDEVPGARVRMAAHGVVAQTSANGEGYFEDTLALAAPTTPGVHDVRLTLLAPAAEPPASAVAHVHVPAATARFGIVSDIDDTVIRTDVVDLVRLARSVLMGNARTRLPFPGVADLYQALRAGPGGACDNPLFYVSSSPWNLYELLEEVFALHSIPAGPLLLRDWGLDGGALPTRHASHKRAAIGRIFETYPALPFIFVGDSGQEDPEIYAALMREHPGRVLAAYIRDVNPAESRRGAIAKLAAELAAEGATLVLAPDTAAAARHARERGWTD